MTSFRIIRGEFAELSSKTLESFAGQFRGALVRENDADYEQARRVFNGLITSGRQWLRAARASRMSSRG